MLLIFQDRIRLPWCGGVKYLSFVTIAPVFILPLLISLAAINEKTFIIIFSAAGLIMCYAFKYVQRKAMRTRFFNMWLISSLVYIIILFESTVPLLEVLPEENLVLVILSILSITCFWHAYKRANLNQVVLPSTTNVEANGNDNEENAEHTTLLLDANNMESERMEEGIEQDLDYQPIVCSVCRKSIPARAAHCALCGVCIKLYDHHSYWLNCCIGAVNHQLYIAGLIFGILALLLGADLTLTAVCHPFLAANILGVQILLPDDCTDVFEMYDLGLAFVISGYALIMAAYSSIILIRQIYLRTLGVTLHESKLILNSNKNPFKNFVL